MEKSIHDHEMTENLHNFRPPISDLMIRQFLMQTTYTYYLFYKNYDFIIFNHIYLLYNTTILLRSRHSNYFNSYKV